MEPRLPEVMVICCAAPDPRAQTPAKKVRFGVDRVFGQCAINIPYNGAKPRVLKELSPKDRIMFVCHGGPMGDELGKLLVQSGYKDVYNLAGGMRKWEGEVVK